LVKKKKKYKVSNFYSPLLETRVHSAYFAHAQKLGTSLEIPQQYWGLRWFSRTQNEYCNRQPTGLRKEYDKDLTPKRLMLDMLWNILPQKSSGYKPAEKPNTGIVFQTMTNYACTVISPVLTDIQSIGIPSDKEVQDALSQSTGAGLSEIKKLIVLEERIRTGTAIFNRSTQEDKENLYLIGYSLGVITEELISRAAKFPDDAESWYLLRELRSYGPDVHGEFWEDFVDLLEMRPKWDAVKKHVLNTLK